jgi:hypothetical protein
LQTGARIPGIRTFIGAHDLKAFALIQPPRTGIPREHHCPRLWANALQADAEQPPPDPLPMVSGVHIEPGEICPIDADKANDLVSETGDKLAGALKAFGVVLLCCQRDEGARITGAAQLLRSCPIVHRTDRRPIGVAIHPNMTWAALCPLVSLCIGPSQWCVLRQPWAKRLNHVV